MDGDFLELYNLHTQLVEACEWDEEKSVELFEDALAAYITLYEYSLHDTSLVQDEEEFSRLIRLNMKCKISDTEFAAVKELLDHKLATGLKEIRITTKE